MRARFAVVLTTAALLAVAGCSGSDADAGGSASPSGGATSMVAPSASGEATSGPSSSTPSDLPTSTSSPTPPAPEGVISPERAEQQAARALTAQNQSVSRSGKAAQQARRSAWTGAGLRAATGDARVAKVRRGSPDNPVFAPVRPNVLAISRGAGHPAYLVVQTEPPDRETPVLHLMRADRASAPFRIQESALMLPGTSIATFDPRENGSVVATGRHPGKAARSALRQLAVKPEALLSDYSRYLSYPRKKVDHRPFAADHFAASVRAGAAQQADAVRTQADFGQSHRVLPGSVVTVQQQGGGALVFAALERHDNFHIKPGQTVKPTKAFQVFAPDQQKIEISARVTTIEFLVFEVPEGTGRATLVGASEHLVGGKGH
ncbi:hypothetical protein [Segeticoccus rhizosphaerae]|jgi:hypothetical protein|uniref:hypothetical protein n=2 Tax=Segeticoccus rhizosphaerae TaxID=1104777 RepID=UPI0010BFB951|nr:hypothetical protein [Ornithinicoccus soli]